MPAFSAPILGFALGAGLFWSAARQLARPIRPVGSPAVLIAGVLGLLAYAPGVALVMSAEPDWSYAYLIPAAALPRWLLPTLILIAGLSVPAGFGVSLRVCRGRSSFAPLLFWLPLGLGVAPLILFGSRLVTQATFQQYHGDFAARSVLGGPLGYLLLWHLLGLLVATLLARRCLDFLALGGADER
jgi:hypothetical protein